MNWDITMGYLRQACGRFLRTAGERLASPATVRRGERIEYAGRLQIRYGALKHQAQWHGDGLSWARDAVPVRVESAGPAQRRVVRRP